jgi:hypothetical protein
MAKTLAAKKKSQGKPSELELALAGVPEGAV